MSRSQATFLPFSYWAISWAVVLLLLLAHAWDAHLSGPLVSAFFIAAALNYAGLFLLPLVLAPLFGAAAKRPLGSRAAHALSFTLIVLWSSAVQLGLLLDLLVFQLYGFHLNGFVWNLVTTPGGLESLGADASAWLMVMAAALVVLAANAVLLGLTLRRATGAAQRLFRVSTVVGVLLICAVGERLVYGVSHFTGRSSVLKAANAIPFYQPTTFRHAAQALGFTFSARHAGSVRAATSALAYPRVPLQLTPPPRLPNIVWLVAESLRADALDENVMPATSAFARTGLRFDQHYSSGNGTRMGLFGMFYGLYGSDWFPMLAAHQQPVLMDVLQRLDYRIEAWSSARFSYPEFSRTVFAGLPADVLHDQATGQGWERDRSNVDSLLGFVRQASSAPDRRPFMAFMFFESPHARYYFPPENAIRKPYLKDLNYATMSLTRDIELIRNRYLNACNHLDSQFGRVFSALSAQGLLDNTIVVVTGDHGEEFMEKGRWGHNSSFVEEQVRTPLVLRMPGVAPGRVSSMSSHLDLPATLLARLGVRNDPADLSLGSDLLGAGPARTTTVVSDWSSVAWIGPDYKAVYPLRSTGLSDAGIFAPNDSRLPNAGSVRAAHVADLRTLLRGITRFHRSVR
ncbi:sulfatase-like hydrolase/transferase [Immundisolibacter sp.]|uniref:sulfatase-like hydrolase/transferase n=1 Tax=Immundisolibacter sp. TaxID=1934948 RepID=UPI003565C97A